jgi:endonuclease/exonuclease/phosphatase family metal-dependent hydrolase
LLVRTWNVFHGRTFPESRSVQLERMVRLATIDAPDVVALQEVPLWALTRLAGWSGMTALGAVAKRGLLGPLARPMQAFAPRLFRSPFTGQANAVLLGRRVRAVGEPRTVVLNPGAAGERRVVHTVEVEAGERRIVVANLHASADRGQTRRAAEAMDGVARAVLCGDFNLECHAVSGFSEPIDGIDQILVKGLEFECPPAPWPEERRRLDDGRLLSDHAPVEAVIA